MLSDAKKRLRIQYHAMTENQLNDVACTFVLSNVMNSGKVTMMTIEQFSQRHDCP